MIASIEKDSPAATAGLKAEDILLAVNGKAVNARFPEQLAAVRKLISDYPVGSKLNLTVLPKWRLGKHDLQATSSFEQAQPRALDPRPITITATTDKLESSITEEKPIAACRRMTVARS